MEIVQSLIAKLTTYNFECEGGPLHNCVDYQKLCVYALMAERDCANDRAETHLADAHSMRDQRDALRASLDRIVSAYDAYRGKGMLPAPNQYAMLVAAIDAAREKP